MQIKMEDRFKGRGTRKCSVCGNSRALIRSHNLHVCRRCFREMATGLGFKKYG
ncbi:MAG TPA: 30S ribosomal protein S14 [Candidatus Acidoferrum sp.]|nr:30S ribosomal protein S14 [Candidatus Acidoferrum sp.]